MTAVKTAEEVYKKYLARLGTDSDGDPDAIALFTYALVERDKYDWIEHHRNENDGASPSNEDIEKWFVSKPDTYFDEKYRNALWWYKAFARSLLAEETKESRLDAIRTYVGDKLSFLPQLLISLACNFIFVLLLGAIAVYIFMDFSPIAWVKTHVFHQTTSP
jgi:hypothetical protein